MRNTETRKLIFSALAVVVNIVLGTIVSWMAIPLLFLDTVGTIFVSATFGMKYGILVGICTNLVMGATTGFTAVPFALVNVAVAIVVALMAKRGFSIPVAVVTGLILSIVAPLIGTPIRILLFGGLTGSGTDLLILAMRAAGQQIFAATFLSTVTGNFVDKVASCVLVAILIKALPESFIGRKKATD